MRKIVNVCGVQRHIGTSETTGKPYDFTEIHFTYDDDRVTGYKTANAIVNQDMIGDHKIVVGELYDMVFSVINNRVLVFAIIF